MAKSQAACTASTQDGTYSKRDVAYPTKKNGARGEMLLRASASLLVGGRREGPRFEGLGRVWEGAVGGVGRRRQ